MANINQRLNGLTPLSYLGDNAVQPPDFVTKDRPPTATDSKGFALGDIWLDMTGYPLVLPTSDDVWMLVALVGNSATWVNFGGSGTVLSVNAGLSISITGTAVNPVVNVAGTVNHTVQLGNAVGSLTSLANGTTGQVLTAQTGADPIWSSTDGFAQSFPTDSGTATPVAGVLNIKAGTATVATNCGSTVEFEATTNTVKLDVTDSLVNTIVGRNSGNLTLSSTNTTVLGAGSAGSLTSSPSNTIVGQASAPLLAGGSGLNTIVGRGSATALVSGSNNLILGRTSGNNLTSSESNNVIMNHAGITGASGSVVLAIPGGSPFFIWDGTDELYVGVNSGNVGTLATNNCVLGASNLMNVTTASSNVLVGNQIMTTATSAGSSNTVVGSAAFNIGTGSNNTIMGSGAFLKATTAATNVVIGNAAGYDSGAGLGVTTGNQNILIGYNVAAAYRGAESMNIIIDNGTGIAIAGESNKTKIAGIRGATTTNNNAIAVLIDSAGQLGTVSSSGTKKDNIVDMGSYSDVIRHLRPVVFNYKEHAPEDKSVGLIAEEVESIAPHLVAYNKDGGVESVKYHDLVPMLLNEFQRHCHLIGELQAVNAQLLDRIRMLEERLMVN